MGWRCSACGESHDDSFTTCWRCGTTRALTSEELAEEVAQARADAQGDAVTERELTREAAILAYEERAGWAPPPTVADRAMAAGAALSRLALAYRFYRQRQEIGSQRSRADLDRAWTLFFLCCAVMGGVFLSIFTSFSMFKALDRHENLAVGLWMGGLLVCVLTGQRAVGKELRAAAEAAVDATDGSAQRVT